MGDKNKETSGIIYPVTGLAKINAIMFIGETQMVEHYVKLTKRK